MKIKVIDKSVTSVSEPIVRISGGKVLIDLNLRCNHALAAVIRSDMPFRTYRVVCLGCPAGELSEQDADEMIETFILEDMKNDLG